MIGGKKYRWEHDSYDLVFRAQDDKNACLISDLQSCWHANKSSSNDAVVARFLKLNKKAFAFLGIIPLESSSSNKLLFKTGNYTGCVPLISPVTGKFYANLIVNGRFNEEVSEILPLLPDSLKIEYGELILPHKTRVKPPIYFECIRFIEKYLVAQRSHWRKFINERRIQPLPASSTDWGEYAVSSYSPDNIFRFPNKVNILTTNHHEWQQINFVLKICLDELNSEHTPRATRLSYRERMNYMLNLLASQSIAPTKELRVHAADPVIIKDLKAIGNRILESNGTEYHAWRIDFNKLFEKYVQLILGNVSLSLHAKVYNNQIFSINGFQTNWTLSHLEPDTIIKKNEKLIIVDAKYKTNMLNMHSGDVNRLHDAFRHDLHQVVAYSSFDPTSQKVTFLVYPSNRFSYIRQVISTSLSQITNHVYLIGIPFGKLPDNNASKSSAITENIRIATEGIEQLLIAEIG